MQLSGQQRKQLQEALIDAFPNTASLEQMLVFELEKNLRVFAGEGSLQNTVFKLIETASSEGWIANLIRAAYNYNPGNSKLQNLVQNFNIQIYHQIDISSLQIKNRSLEDRVNQLQKEFRDFQERYDKILNAFEKFRQIALEQLENLSPENIDTKIALTELLTKTFQYQLALENANYAKKACREASEFFCVFTKSKSFLSLIEYKSIEIAK